MTQLGKTLCPELYRVRQKNVKRSWLAFEPHTHILQLGTYFILFFTHENSSQLPCDFSLVAIHFKSVV